MGRDAHLHWHAGASVATLNMTYEERGIQETLMSSPQGFDPKEIVHRIGTFFILVGIGLIVFFVLSEAARQVVFDYFCWGLLLLVIGFVFRGQYRKSVSPSGRFSLVRKLMPKSKKEAEKKK